MPALPGRSGRCGPGPATVGLKSRWAATLVKEEGRWVLVSFSASTNAFDNEVITLYRRGTVVVAGLVCAVVGLAIGGLLGAFLL